MAPLNIVMQLIGIGVGIYLIFAKGLGVGIALIAIVAIGYFVFSLLSNLLILVHQKTMMSEQEVQITAIKALGFNPEPPAAWKAIAIICGLAYFSSNLIAIWYFLAVKT